MLSIILIYFIRIYLLSKKRDYFLHIWIRNKNKDIFFTFILFLIINQLCNFKTLKQFLSAFFFLHLF